MTTAPPLPRGFTVRLARDTTVRDAGRTLVGGATGAVLRLRPAALGMLGTGGTVVSDGGAAGTLARLLLDRELAHPCGLDALPGAPGLAEVTVVVPVKDRADGLARLLASLPASLPVVVVDDGSADPDRITAVAGRRTVLRHESSLGPAAARNTGLLAVETELVAFLDSDVVPAAGWLERLLPHFADPAVGVVGPRVVALERASDDGWLARYEAARSSLDLGPAPAAVRPHGRVAYLPSAALVLRRAAAPDGFDARMHVAEDVDLVWRVHRAGWKVRYEPAAVVRHEHRTRLRAWWMRKAFYGTGAALLADRHGGAVAPVVLAPWTAALSVLVLAQRRWSVATAGALTAVVGWRIGGRLVGTDHPRRTGMTLALRGAAAAVRQAGDALTRHWWPVAAVLALRSRRVRRAVLVAGVAEALLDHRERAPAMGPVRYLLARRLDDLAYGAGLWTGAVRARSPQALLPLVRSGPPRRRGAR